MYEFRVVETMAAKGVFATQESADKYVCHFSRDFPEWMQLKHFYCMRVDYVMHVQLDIALITDEYDYTEVDVALYHLFDEAEEAAHSCYLVTWYEYE